MRITYRTTLAVYVMLLLALWLPCTSTNAQDNKLKPLRVQLQWSHQAQFAGFYLAQAHGYFAAVGLEVTLIEGGDGINPITRLQDGDADIAVAWLNNAWRSSTPEHSVTNIAQIIQEPGLILVCRRSLGVLSPADIAGKTIGIWSVGDDVVVRAMLNELGLPRSEYAMVAQRAQGQDLIDGTVACATAMNYNEYWRILQSGIPATDLLTITPSQLGIAHIEDGLYVQTQRLASPGFRQELVAFVEALSKGWQLAAQSPQFALETTLAQDAQLDARFQRSMLEAILPLINLQTERFGHLDLHTFESAVKNNRTYSDLPPLPALLWTHQIDDAVQPARADRSPWRESTRHYISHVSQGPLFILLSYIGLVSFALSGLMDAITRGYDLWGRLVLAFLVGLGGGTIRDFLIGEARMPLSYVLNPWLPATVLLVVVIGTALTLLYRNLPDTKWFKRIELWAEYLGFSITAAAGALIAVRANMPWYWIPVLAALSCAGGGMLRDIVINREPRTFKGQFYEEQAFIGGVVLMLGLWIANAFEHTDRPVYAAVACSFLAVLASRILVDRYQIRYPKSWTTPRNDPGQT
jgi:NitT/TauT family transport system substrate-binding protein